MVFMDHSYWSPDDSSPKSTGHRFASSFSEADALNSSISVIEARSWAWVDCAAKKGPLNYILSPAFSTYVICMSSLCMYVYMYLFLTLFVYLFMSSSILTIFYRICETLWNPQQSFQASVAARSSSCCCTLATWEASCSSQIHPL